MTTEVKNRNRGRKTRPRPVGGDEPQEVTRYISPTVQAILWGKAAGRCEFAGCNVPLWKSPVTQEAVNIGEKAHIYSFSSGGPRGNDGVAKELLNNIENLILVCPICHLKIDNAPAADRYTVARVQAMKALHETRVELVTGIHTDLKSQVVFYGANIGDHSSPRLVADAAGAMFPHRYPAQTPVISLGTGDNPTTDREAHFWKTEAAILESHFRQRVRERLMGGELTHLSVFALVPQPLLILLGTLLGDICPADVYQRHREPPTWAWPSVSETPEFVVENPTTKNGSAALVLALSATVTRDRIESVLGQEVCIWEITVPEPHNELTKSREQLSRFRALVRKQLDRIKAVHGQNAPLHIFPAISTSMAVELGRIRMPKADMPWHVYDQIKGQGFIHALSIPNGEQQ